MDVTAVASLPTAAKPTATRPPVVVQAPGGKARASGGNADAVGHNQFHVALDIDEASRRVVATIIDTRTGVVVDQMPPEQLRKIAAEIRELLRPVIDETV